MHDLDANMSLYASYTDIFHKQNSTTFEGAMVLPAIGANYEAGIKSVWRDGALNASRFSSVSIRRTARNRTRYTSVPVPAHPPVAAPLPRVKCGAKALKSSSSVYLVHAAGGLDGLHLQHHRVCKGPHAHGGTVQQ